MGSVRFQDWTWLIAKKADSRRGPIGPQGSLSKSYTHAGPSSLPSGGAVGPYRPKSEFRQISVETPIWHDMPHQGLTDLSTVSYPYATKLLPRAPMVASGAAGCPSGKRRAPGGQLAARRAPSSRNPTVWGSYEARTAICQGRDLCTLPDGVENS